MAKIGLLGIAVVDQSIGTATVYTVPNNVSHAVVHVALGASGQVTSGTTPLNGAAALLNGSILVATPYNVSSVGSTGWVSAPVSTSTSIMLSPGDSISATRLGSNGGGSVAVTGYEVP